MIVDRKGECHYGAVVRLEIEWSDGTREGLEGDEARIAWAAMLNCMAIAQIHGCGYKGPKMRVVKTKQENT